MKGEKNRRLNTDSENNKRFQTNFGRWKADERVEIKMLIPLKREERRQPWEFHLTK